MYHLLTLATLLLAIAAPGADARRRPKKDKKIDCPDLIVEKLFVKDLPVKSDFEAAGSAVATGDNTDTHVDQWLLQGKGNYYSAVLYGAADDGEVYLENSGYGGVADCKKVLLLEWREVFQTCYFQEYVKIVRLCNEAKSYFSSSAFAYGEGAYAYTSTDSVQIPGGAGTSQFAHAEGGDGAGVTLDQQDTVESKKSSNSASASTTALALGNNSEVTAHQETQATERSSYSGTKVSATSGGGKHRRVL